MRLAAVQAFQRRSDELGAELAPVTLVLPDETVITTAYSTGSAPRELMRADAVGLEVEEMTQFRVPKADLATAPAIGALLRRQVTGQADRMYRVMEVPDRPQETSWLLRCAWARMAPPAVVDTFEEGTPVDTFEEGTPVDTYEMAA